jgi:hypothetical protein
VAIVTRNKAVNADKIIRHLPAGACFIVEETWLKNIESSERSNEAEAEATGKKNFVPCCPEAFLPTQNYKLTRWRTTF